MKQKRVIYNEYKADKFLSKFIPIAKSQLVKEISEIKLKFPFFLKIISNDALHKTDINGVKLVNNKDELLKNFNNLMQTAKRKKIKLDGIIAQEKIEGQQLIIGIKKDEIFNHIILFGLGGIFTEVLDDISIRKCPINKNDAQEMIDELKSRKVFYGFRGEKLSLEFLKKILIKVSEIPLKHKNIQELDINPFILNEKDGKVADSRIVFA